MFVSVIHLDAVFCILSGSELFIYWIITNVHICKSVAESHSVRNNQTTAPDNGRQQSFVHFTVPTLPRHVRCTARNRKEIRARCRAVISSKTATETDRDGCIDKPGGNGQRRRRHLLRWGRWGNSILASRDIRQNGDATVNGSTTITTITHDNNSNKFIVLTRRFSSACQHGAISMWPLRI